MLDDYSVECCLLSTGKEDSLYKRFIAVIAGILVQCAPTLKIKFHSCLLYDKMRSLWSMIDHSYHVSISDSMDQTSISSRIYSTSYGTIEHLVSEYSNLRSFACYNNFLEDAGFV